MLAGPRKKQKISLDPRNKQWIDDSSKFGLRLMQKMGWSNGQGLGANMDGETENVKVVMKADTKGLGFSNKEEDNWIAHQDDFNDILSQLHQEHNGGGGVVTVTPKSIEERSKNSKRRVHYKKFTQGKDLANRSVDDMNCILGKRSSGSSTPNSTSAPTSDTEDDNNMTVNSVSVQDYFAQKMSRMKKAKVINGDCAEGNSQRAGNFPNNDTSDENRETVETNEGNMSEEAEDGAESSKDQWIVQSGRDNDATNLEESVVGFGGNREIAERDACSEVGSSIIIREMEVVKKKKKKRKKRQQVEDLRNGEITMQGHNDVDDGTERNDENGFDEGDNGGCRGVEVLESGMDDGPKVKIEEQLEMLKQKRKKNKKKKKKDQEC